MPKAKDITMIPLINGSTRITMELGRGSAELELTQAEAIQLLHELTTCIKLSDEKKDARVALMSRDLKMYKQQVSDLHNRLSAQDSAPVTKGFNAEWM